MDLDSDYYSSRCEDINSQVYLKTIYLKRLLPRLWVGTVIIKHYFILT
jgi:hypothetical protein